MLTVYKYQARIEYHVKVKMPSGAKILKGDEQNGAFVIWALVNTENELVTRNLRLVATGRTIAEPVEKLVYINTFTSVGGLVWHLFEFVA